VHNIPKNFLECLQWAEIYGLKSITEIDKYDSAKDLFCYLFFDTLKELAESKKKDILWVQHQTRENSGIGKYKNHFFFCTFIKKKKLENKTKFTLLNLEENIDLFNYR
jgi:hypothetical protein